MSRHSALLSREAGEALLQLHPGDGRRLGVRSGDMVSMRSRRGEVQVKAQLTETVKAGEIYTTFHFSEMPVNRLTINAKDHFSQCPEYKICAVHLEKV